MVFRFPFIGFLILFAVENMWTKSYLPQVAAKLTRAAANLASRMGGICRGPRQMLLAMMQIYEICRAQRQIKLAASRGKFDLPRPAANEICRAPRQIQSCVMCFSFDVRKCFYCFSWCSFIFIGVHNLFVRFSWSPIFYGSAMCLSCKTTKTKTGNDEKL